MDFDNWLTNYRKPENFAKELHKKLSFIKSVTVKSDKEIPGSRFYKMKETLFEVKDKNDQEIPGFPNHIIDKVDCVNVVLFDPKRNAILLIQQFRGASFMSKGLKFSLEFPGGLVDENETPEQAAIREAKEESGANVENVVFFKKFFVSPGVFKQETNIFFSHADFSTLPEISGLAAENETTNLVIVPIEHIDIVKDIPEAGVGATLMVLEYLNSYHKNERGELTQGIDIIKAKLEKQNINDAIKSKILEDNNNSRS